MHVMRVLIDVTARAGVARERMLHALRLDEEQLASRTQLSYQEAMHAAETALSLAGDPAFGLRWAKSLSIDTFSPSTYLITNAATLGEGLDALLKYSKLLSDQAHLAVRYDADEVRLQCPTVHAGSPAFQRVVAELTVIAFIRIVRSFVPTFRPERVCFEYPAPPYHHEYPEVFGSAALFDQPYTGLVFQRLLLAAKAQYRDQGLHDTLRTLAERHITTGDRSPQYAARVQDLLVRRGRVGGPAMSEVSTQLGLSVHALRRRLSAEATTFAAIEQEAFAALVQRALIDDRRTIQEAAFELGFAGTASFHRAFKRALGITPLAYLHAQLAGGRG